MTSPQDPYAPQPEGQPGQGNQPPPPPGYGAPPPGYGQLPAYPQNPYGQMPYGFGVRPELASWGQRVGAALIDALMLAIVSLVGVILVFVLGQVSDAGLVLAVVALYGGTLGFLIWQMVVQGRTGQTIGKKQVGIRLVRESDGQCVGAGLSIGRYFLHVVDQLPCYLGYFWPLWDDKKQTFADKLVGTLVIKG